MIKKGFHEILSAMDILPFPTGKKLLIDILTGNAINKSIRRNRLDRQPCFGSLSLYSPNELSELIDSLAYNGYIEYYTINNFQKTIRISMKGNNFLENPYATEKPKIQVTAPVTDEDKELFKQFDFFLGNCNDEQKKAIISPAKNILCIAGAGTGKTTALTKRIEFLIKFRSINPSKILAITFTRKARTEMMHRLAKSNIITNVETFNSLCEKFLLRNEKKIYGHKMSVIKYSDRIKLIKQALSHLKLNMDRAIEVYFSGAQRRGKSQEELGAIFLNDLFMIRDVCKADNKSLGEVLPDAQTPGARMMYSLCQFIDNKMKTEGLRDFSDQLVDAMDFMRNNKKMTPKYTHILVDEFQDINSAQIQLVNLMYDGNIFCVGDPRQSIFGWRGSRINYILNFAQLYPEHECMTLTENYRSSEPIVNLINKSIEYMKLPTISATKETEGDIKLFQFSSEEQEHEFIATVINYSTINPDKTFILSRTNRQLTELSYFLNSRKIKHDIRKDDTHHSNGHKVILSTIHAIKGLEADSVFIIGCNAQNFPCKASDHPAVDMVKQEEYDKEDEERRLLYVALSRAKKQIFVSYTGTLSRFVSNGMREMLE